MRGAALATLLALAGCVAAPRPQTTVAGASPAGTWLAIVAGGDAYPLGCDSDAPLMLDVDGRYLTYGDVGEWTLRGDRLTLLTTEPSPVFPDVRVGDRHTHRLRRAGRDEMWLGTVRYRRCPPR